MPSLVRIETTSGPMLLNLDLVISVDEIAMDHCRLNFGHTSFEIIGAGANELVDRLLDSAANFRITAEVEPFELELPAP